jgi:hypothetical protein
LLKFFRLFFQSKPISLLQSEPLKPFSLSTSFTKVGVTSFILLIFCNSLFFARSLVHLAIPTQPYSFL